MSRSGPQVEVRCRWCGETYTIPLTRSGPLHVEGHGPGVSITGTDSGLIHQCTIAPTPDDDPRG
jgi:hypothetical protein